MADNALIEWTGLGAKHIATQEGNAFFIPGAITPVPVAVWQIARPWVKDLIVEDARSLEQKDKDNGRFVEHFVSVEAVEIPEKKGGGGKIVEEARTEYSVSAKDLSDLKDSEARAVIAKIVDIAVLESYLTSEALDAFPALKGAIERQIKDVNEKGTPKGSK